MTYAPLDDRFDEHPKYADLGPGEMGLIACAISYSTRHRSDGVVAKVWPNRRFGRAGVRYAACLVARGIWRIRSDGNYEIVGFLEHNPSKAEVLEKIANKAAAGRLGAAKRHEAAVKARAQAVAQARADQLPNPSATPPPPPPPSTQQIPRSPLVADASKLEPAPASGRLPSWLVNVEREQWIAAYERGVTKTRQGEVWSFPRKAFNALQSVVEVHCLGSHRKNIPEWIEREVVAFVKAVQSLGVNPMLWSSFGPDGLQRWRNEERPGGQSKGPETHEAYLERAKRQDAEYAERKATAAPPPVADLMAALGNERGSGVIRTRPVTPTRKGQDG
jgi:hypothetical protein